jgi:pimeloyl-ACP methyl ester carboxylesterase
LFWFFVFSCTGKNPANPSLEAAGGQSLKPVVPNIVNIDEPHDGRSNRPPLRMTLAAPHDDSMFCMLNSNQTMTFVWTSSVDPDGDTVSYAWFLVDAGEEQVLLFQETGQDTSFVMDKSAISTVFPSDCAVYRAYWKVRATDGRSAVFSTRSDVAILNQPAGSSTLPSSFPNGFSRPHDQLTGNTLGGWGGCSGCVTHAPIVFVHGNGNTADAWRVVAQRFLDNGYVTRELWAISYLDYAGGDSATSSMANVEDIDEFVNAVLDYTGAKKVDVIAHSLGVTVARAWMKKKDAFAKVGHFVAIAGPNHGVNFCYGPLAGSALCREIGHPNSEFLTYLNVPDETPFDETVAYMTIYDGTTADFYFPPVAVFNDGSVGDLRMSPRLEGASNMQLAGKDHMALKDSQESFDLMFNFVTSNGMYVRY